MTLKNKHVKQWRAISHPLLLNRVIIALHLASHLSSRGSWRRVDDLAYFWQKQKANMGLRMRQTAHERTNHTTEREIKPKHILVKPDSPISLHASAQIVSAYCLLGWLTDWFIGYNPDWECNDLKFHVSRFQGAVVRTQKFVLLLPRHVFIIHSGTVNSYTVGRPANPPARKHLYLQYSFVHQLWGAWHLFFWPSQTSIRRKV